MTLKVQILQSLRRLFITLVGLTMTWFGEKMLIFNKCRRGLMPNLIKKSWTVSTLKLGAVQLNEWKELILAYNGTSKVEIWYKAFNLKSRPVKLLLAAVWVKWIVVLFASVTGVREKISLIAMIINVVARCWNWHFFASDVWILWVGI